MCPVGETNFRPAAPVRLPPRRAGSVAEQVEPERLVGRLLAIAIGFDGDGLGRLARGEGQDGGPGEVVLAGLAARCVVKNYIVTAWS